MLTGKLVEEEIVKVVAEKEEIVKRKVGGEKEEIGERKVGGGKGGDC